MRRAIFPLVLASMALTCALASGAAARWDGASAAAPTAKHTASEEPIAMRLRYRLGPWKKSLYLKLVKTRLTAFSVCAIRNWQAGQKFSCDVRGESLQENTTLRLEQNPRGRGLARDDSPGWGMLGISVTARIGAVLSNELTGDKFGTYNYRVTLRDQNGQVLATSNKVVVTWHK